MGEAFKVGGLKLQKYVTDDLRDDEDGYEPQHIVNEEYQTLLKNSQTHRRAAQQKGRAAEKQRASGVFSWTSNGD